MAFDQSHRFARALRGDLLSGIGNDLIQQRKRIAHGALCRAGDQSESARFGFDPFGLADLIQATLDLGQSDSTKIKALAARQNGRGNLMGLGRGKDEDDVSRGLFQSLQQRIESCRSEHVHFIDDVDFLAARGRHVLRVLTNLADGIDPVIGGAVDLDHVDAIA